MDEGVLRWDLTAPVAALLDADRRRGECSGVVVLLPAAAAGASACPSADSPSAASSPSRAYTSKYAERVLSTKRATLRLRVVSHVTMVLCPPKHSAGMRERSNSRTTESLNSSHRPPFALEPAPAFVPVLAALGPGSEADEAALLPTLLLLLLRSWMSEV